MWSISIYTGDSPFELKPIQSEPVLSSVHVTDITAAFVADPFMLHRDRTWYMFMEVMNADTRLGEIGVATSKDALAWTYQQIVLKEPFHLSYPYVFHWQNEYYMIPETIGSGAIWLYKAAEFPNRWAPVTRLISGCFADPSVFRLNNLWWMFACPTPYQHDTLYLYFAASLAGPWGEHPRSPIVKNDKCRARPAGRILNFNGRLFRFGQDCGPRYGSSVRAFEILELTTTTYSEVESDRSPILTATGHGWNASGMHHIDTHRQSNGKWLACVDGVQ
jgi:hypothetical protein